MQFFKHMGNMHDDPAIRRLITKHGMEGFGLYCLSLELITSRICNDRPLPNLDESPEDFEDFFNCDKAGEILEYLVTKKLLKKNGSGVIECPNIYKYFMTSQTKSPAIRGLIDKYSEARSREKVTEVHGRSQTFTEVPPRKKERVSGEDKVSESTRLLGQEDKGTWTEEA